MFILDGKPLSPDVAFTATNADGNLIQFPANWLRLASPEEREAIGITEVPDPAPYDQRFYWGPDLPKDHAQLVEQWTQQTRATANTLLQPSDWLVIREADNGTVMDADTKALRQDIRLATGTKVAAIEATADTAELAAYITSFDYSQWPPYPEPELEEPEAEPAA
jgi:hypothetical protein